MPKINNKDKYRIIESLRASKKLTKDEAIKYYGSISQKERARLARGLR